MGVPYRTLHRYAVAELGFGRGRKTVRVADGEPGAELQVDFGRLGMVGPAPGPRRLVRGPVFTPGVSRYTLYWVTSGETLPEVIEGFEEAWAFYGGVFRVAIPDNLKAIVLKADPLHPHRTPGFLKYAQARGFVIDPGRVRAPTQKPRVERAVPYCRASGFAGEHFRDLEAARRGMRRWCGEDAGLRCNGTTQRRPREHFRAEELAHLLPAPTARYDVPVYATPRVARDHHCAVAKALYSVPGGRIGERIDARADRQLVRLSARGQVIKVHPGGRPGAGRPIRPICPR